MKRPTGALAQGHKVKNQASSTNWSGYAVTGSAGQFNSVSASWTQPTANCTGTDSDCNGTSPDYYGWYEMYPAYPVYFSNPVAPGDSMSASVTFSGTDTYTLVLTDSTQGLEPDHYPERERLVEVITEAPSSSSGVLPLADFGTINYGGSSANGSAMSALNPTGIIIVDGNGQQDTTSSIDSYGDFSNGWLSSY